MFHSLENKNASIPTIVPVKDTETIKDSVRAVEIEKPYPVPAEFTKWEVFYMQVGKITFWMVIVVVLVVIGYLVGRKLLKRYLPFS